MKKCSFCAQPNPDDLKQCQFCRTPLPQTAKRPGRPAPAGLPIPQAPSAEVSLAPVPVGLQTPQAPAAEAPLPPAPPAPPAPPDPAVARQRLAILIPLLIVLGFLVLRPLYLSLTAANLAASKRLSERNYLAGRLAFTQGDHAKARQLWEAALRADPQNRFAELSLRGLDKRLSQK